MALLDNARNPLGPLAPDLRRAIAEYLDSPTVAGWNAIRQTALAPANSGKIMTLWQLVIREKPGFINARLPRKGEEDDWTFIPDAILLAGVIKRHTGRAHG